MMRFPWFVAFYFFAVCSWSAVDSLTVNPVQVGEGSTVTIHFEEGGNPNCFPGTSQSYRLDFGDGTSQTKAGSCGPDDSFTTTHVYIDNSNSFRLTCGTASATVTVANVPPAIAPIQSFYAMVGQSVSNWVSFTDPGSRDTFIATVNYGDGSPAQVINVGTLRNFRLDHAFAAPGTYRLSVTVTDKDGGTDTQTTLATVGETATAPVTLSGYLFSGLVLQGFPGGTYDIQYQSTLGTSNWSTLATVTLTNSEQLWIDTDSTNSVRRFYRAVGK
jgi:hypothetical protein